MRLPLAVTSESIFKVLNSFSESSSVTAPPCIGSITDNLEDVEKNSLFVAIKGARFDGHNFIAQAIEKGASGIVGEQPLELSVPYFKVSNARQTIARLANEAVGVPSKDLLAIAVTGTNGKTTTHWILAHVLESLGLPCLKTGTLGASLGSKVFSDDTLTTPSSLQLASFLHGAKMAGAKAWSTEASSHALVQGRLHGQQLDGAIFTNLTRDHLDYHGTMSEYFNAKALLFEALGSSNKLNHKVAAIHLQPDYGEKMATVAREATCNVVTFGGSEAKQADIVISQFHQTLEGSELTLNDRGASVVIRTPLIGAHNAENITGVYAVLTRLGFDRHMILSSFANLPQVPGRLERVVARPFQIFVDYAHTPDALERVLQSLRPLCHGKLWVVFGCGGDRDRGKRPQMLEVCLQGADRVVITSDNPRTENPDSIIQDILAADVHGTAVREGIVEPDRRRAIEKSVAMLQKGDILIVAGKGHEDYQIIGTTKYHFSDQEEIRKLVLS